MSQIQFLQLAWFGSIFNRANYSSGAGKNAGFFMVTSHGIPKVLQYKLS
jgi:hypothetical protein